MSLTAHIDNPPFSRITPKRKAVMSLCQEAKTFIKRARSSLRHRNPTHELVQDPVSAEVSSLVADAALGDGPDLNSTAELELNLARAVVEMDALQQAVARPVIDAMLRKLVQNVKSTTKAVNKVWTPFVGETRYRRFTLLIEAAGDGVVFRSLQRYLLDLPHDAEVNKSQFCVSAMTMVEKSSMSIHSTMLMAPRYDHGHITSECLGECQWEGFSHHGERWYVPTGLVVKLIGNKVKLCGVYKPKVLRAN
ncbi:MAG: hypothetical protein Marn2KO_36910 [Marinobacter nauticus]